jgi:hypothetical protein
MFESRIEETELLSGERHGDTGGVDPLLDDGFDDLVYLVTVDEMSTGWADDDRHLLPDFDSIRPGSFMAVVLELVDRSKLNGHDLVTLLQARERLGVPPSGGVDRRRQ